MSRKALVVGASGGSGRAIAERLANDGWDILAHGRDLKRPEETSAAIQRIGRACDAKTADLTSKQDIIALAGWACGHDDLSAVVFCAGGGKSVDTGPEAVSEWERTLAAILHAPMLLTALTIDRMKHTEGAYLYICGMYAKIGMPRMAAHCAGRHGLEGFAKAFFEEVRETGVSATLLHPGFVHSGFTDTNKLDPECMIAVEDIADMASLAINLPKRACVTEMIVRPQRSPYR